MAVWAWQTKGGELSIGPCIADLLQCLQALNKLPKTRERPFLSHDVAGSAAYSVSCILADLAGALRSKRARADQEAGRQLEWAIEVACHAWSQVLAGDIEDVIQDIRDSGIEEA